MRPDSVEISDMQVLHPCPHAPHPTPQWRAQVYDSNQEFNKYGMKALGWCARAAASARVPLIVWLHRRVAA